MSCRAGEKFRRGAMDEDRWCWRRDLNPHGRCRPRDFECNACVSIYMEIELVIFRQRESV